MPEVMISRPKTLRWIGLAAIAIWILSASLWSQVSSPPQPDHPAKDGPFAGYDGSLTKAADTFLVSSPLAPIGVAEKASAEGAPSESHAIRYSRQFRRDSLSVAAARPDVRLEMLRPVVEPILRHHGVPSDVAAVILVESGARADALSPRGARGLWQLMPDTARRYGLRVDDTEDDRLDIFRATAAAAQYLHDLYAQFGDWKLALAAYNAGEANVGSAILKAHTQDFN